MKSSREQFEEWWANYVDKCAHQVEDVEYYAAKEAWQASRAAIEIELPDKVMVEDDFDNGHNCAIDYCADAIHAAGLTVKGDA